MAISFILTENFSLDEFKVSDSFPEIASKIEFDRFDIQRIKLLCLLFLQPARDSVGKIRILSGKRSKELNSLIGGSENSDHLYSGAVDFISNNVLWLKDFWLGLIKRKYLPYGQSIIYFDNVGINLKFIHVSLVSCKHFQESYMSIDNELKRI